MKEEETSGTSIVVLEREITNLEDEVSEARLEASRLKAELVSEKSASHVKVSELHSRINEVLFINPRYSVQLIYLLLCRACCLKKNYYNFICLFYL